MNKKKIVRILIAKPGLDGHDRGAKIIAKSLRDSGYEVIYTGLRNTAEEIVSIALQEDVDIIGLSILSGSHMHYAKKIINLLENNGLSDLKVIIGGIIPSEDIKKLKEIGVKEVFGPGTPIAEIILKIENLF